MPESDTSARTPAGGFAASVEPLYERYDVALLDLDGVVYRQEDPVPAASEALAAVREAGMRLTFVTNNASRRPEQVAELLIRVGVPAVADDVVTSAQASARLLAERLPAGAVVLVIGTDGLAEEISAVGLRPTRTADAETVAVVQGYGREVGWSSIAEAAVAIRAGALWVATNTDLTVPSPRGPLPGNGALVEAVAVAMRKRPDVIVGKPHPRLHTESVVRSEAKRPLVVGDRLDTDIEGANNAGTDSLLVLTGVTTAADLLAAEPRYRPTYVAEDLRGLLEPHAVPETEGVGGGVVVEHRGWSVSADGEALGLRATGDGASAIDALRALAVAAWSMSLTDVRPDCDAAVAAVKELGLN